MGSKAERAEVESLFTCLNAVGEYRAGRVELREAIGVLEDAFAQQLRGSREWMTTFEGIVQRLSLDGGSMAVGRDPALLGLLGDVRALVRARLAALDPPPAQRPL